MLVARRNDSSDKKQPLSEHIKTTAENAQRWAEPFGISNCAKLAGLLHDYGKADSVWQNKLGKDSLPAHAPAGAALLGELFDDDPAGQMAAQLAEIAVLWHHSGLGDLVDMDGGESFCERVSGLPVVLYADYFGECASIDELKELARRAAGEINSLEREISRIAKEYGRQNPDNYKGILWSLTIRALYSCLIDADRTDAASWAANEIIDEKNGGDVWEEYYRRLIVYLEGKTLKADAAEREKRIFEYRRQISEGCDKAAGGIAEKFTDVRGRDRCGGGVWQLHVPTGGGKTLASLRFALKLASDQKSRIKRIFYIIPYTTILEQTARDIRAAIGDDDAVLEHYSSFVPEEIPGKKAGDEDDVLSKYLLAAERWNAPIILTTQVQFLNALYSGRPAAARRMHMLSDSIIIFDEVQAVPAECISLFCCGVTMLSELCGSTVVLCSATQPTFDNVQFSIPEPTPIIRYDKEMWECFRRVTVEDRTHRIVNTSDIADLIVELECKSLLAVLSTKSSVLKVYQELKNRSGVDGLYHLSTSMCPKHRTKILDEIRSRLDMKEKVICISTSLIEAGVDISFACVIRSLTGLDSVAQAAGRCNRHGELKDGGRLIIIDEGKEPISRMKWLVDAHKTAKGILYAFAEDPDTVGGDLFSREVLECYYDNLYEEAGGMLNYRIPEKEVFSRGLKKGLNLTDLYGANKHYANDVKKRRSDAAKNQPFCQALGTAGEIFRVIADDTVAVLTPYDEGREWIKRIDAENMRISDFRRITPYCVNLYSYNFSALERAGYIRRSEKYGVYILDESCYDDEIGVVIGSISLEDLVV